MLPIASPQRAIEVFRAEFDAAWRHGALWNAVWHPFVSGRLARCDAMIELIEYMKSKGGLWFARLDEIATHVRARRWLPDGRRASTVFRSGTRRSRVSWPGTASYQISLVSQPLRGAPERCAGRRGRAPVGTAR